MIGDFKSWLLGVLLPCVAAVLVALLSHNCFAQGTEKFATLKGAATSNDLPLGNSTNGGGDSSVGLPSELRPNVLYPTLRLDYRSPRHEQAPEPAHIPTEELTNVEAPLTDFEQLVEQTLGQRLPVFGHKLFQQNARGFEPVEQAAVPGDFMLGPGDEIFIKAWGSIDIDYSATIDRRGAINLPKVGEISLAGVRFDQSEKHIRAVMARSFKGFDLSISMGQLRSVRVYVTGYAKSPGSYTVNSLSTLINVLFHAGGPSAAGSLRDVTLVRNGRTIASVDLYDFILNGNYRNDLRVMPEDVIHIAAKHGEVAIAGAVNRSGIYQLAPNEQLSDLLEFGGGLSVTASTHRVVVERIEQGVGRTVRETELDSGALQGSLRTGDLVLIQPVSPEFTNAVTLRGHVAQPLRHEWTNNMRVSTLLPSSEALLSPNYWIERNTQNQVTKLITEGPNTIPRIDAPTINWEHALVERTDPITLKKQLIPFDLGKAVLERDPRHDLLLFPGDHVTVFSLDDFRTRTAQKPRYVRVEGEVANAGFYVAKPHETIRDLIEKAGGLTENAYLYGMELRRDSVKQQQLERIHEFIDHLERDYYRHLINRSRNVVSGEMTTAIVPEAAAIRGFISALRETEPLGRIVLELNDTIRHVGDLPAIEMADKDVIYVPPVPISVEVVGAVYRQDSFIYNSDSVVNYVQRAGLLRTADPKATYVVRPDGSFTVSHKRLKLKPGDTIFVPELVDRESRLRATKDWTQILYQFGLGAAGIKLLEIF